MFQPASFSGAIKSVSEGFADWLYRESLNLFVSTYQHDRLLALSADGSRNLTVSSWPLDRPMGLAVSDSAIRVATRFGIREYRPEPAAADFEPVRYRLASTALTGFLDAHDLAVSEAGDFLLIDTLHSCLRRIDGSEVCEPLWRPPFVTELVPEDRCHLNGLAVADGRPRYATAVGRSDAPEGWRTESRGGGVLWDLACDEPIATGLSMPHSPRIHGGRIWLLNSGTGELGYVAPTGGDFEPVCRFPGFLRGLVFYREKAIAGVSRTRRGRGWPGDCGGTGSGEENEAICGLAVVDWATGDLRYLLEFAPPLSELYDVQLLIGSRRPALAGVRS